jgi:hypothetical protein
MITQSERQRIEGRLAYQHPAVERLRAQGKNVPDLKDSARDVLLAEYRRGLAEAGPRGAGICRSVLQLCEERDIGTDFLDQFRSDWQRERLQSAQQQRILAHTVYDKVPLPSSGRPGGPKTVGEAAAGKRRSALGLKKKGTTTAKPRQKNPRWK